MDHTSELGDELQDVAEKSRGVLYPGSFGVGRGFAIPTISDSSSIIEVHNACRESFRLLIRELLKHATTERQDFRSSVCPIAQSLDDQMVRFEIWVSDVGAEEGSLDTSSFELVSGGKPQKLYRLIRKILVKIYELLLNVSEEVARGVEHGFEDLREAEEGFRKQEHQEEYDSLHKQQNVMSECIGQIDPLITNLFDLADPVLALQGQLHQNGPYWEQRQRFLTVKNSVRPTVPWEAGSFILSDPSHAAQSTIFSGPELDDESVSDISESVELSPTRVFKNVSESRWSAGKTKHSRGSAISTDAKSTISGWAQSSRANDKSQETSHSDDQFSQHAALPKIAQKEKAIKSHLRDPLSDSESDFFNLWTYRPLKSSTSLRLIKLMPGHGKNSEVICELIEVDQSESGFEQQYDVVSGAWEGKRSESICIRDKDEDFYLNVHPSLKSALQALRTRRIARYLWIDAVCINQVASSEKFSQVAMMSQIYTGAKNVCLWVGPPDENSQIALEFIKKDVLQFWEFDKLCEDVGVAPKWASLLNFMQRSWFTRRWAVQEIALAKSATLHCGMMSISWQDFADAVSLLVEVESATYRLSEVMKKDPTFYHLPGFFDYVSSLPASLLVEATSDLFRDANNVHRKPILSLEQLVSRLSAFDSVEPRDAVYALLSIAKDTSPRAAHEQDVFPRTKRILETMLDVKPYLVDYERPIAEVCGDFVHFSIHQSDRARALDILCRPWAPKASSSMEVLPSWVAGTENGAFEMYHQPGMGLCRVGRKNADPLVGFPGLTPVYKAAGTTNVDLSVLQFRKRESFFSMSVKGFVLDRVQNVMPISLGGYIPEEWFVAGSYNDAAGDPLEEFWRTLVADRGRHGRNPPTYYKRAYKESFKTTTTSTSLNMTELINNGRCTIVGEYLRRVQEVVWNRRLIRTENGRLGIVYPETQVGDIICIFHGCSVPVTLRKFDKTDEEISKERLEEKRELRTKLEKFVVPIQRRFRHKQKRVAEDQRKKALLKLLNKEWERLAAIEGVTSMQAKEEQAIVGIQRAFQSHYQEQANIKLPSRLLQTEAIHDEQIEPIWERLVKVDSSYYKLIGPCYIHGMMDGEAIYEQNMHGRKEDQIFEMR